MLQKTKEWKDKIHKIAFKQVRKQYVLCETGVGLPSSLRIEQPEGNQAILFLT